jgi:DNA-binding IclR family transcriptional regulator
VPPAGRADREHLQALTRGVQALALMNRVGATTNGGLAKLLGLKHSTAHRLLMVLTDMGFLRHDPLGHQFVLAGAVRELAAGFHDLPCIDEVALPRMRDWTRREGLALLLVTETAGTLTVRAATDAHWATSAPRYVAGNVLAARGSCEAVVLRSFGTTPPGVRDGARGSVTVLRQGYARRARPEIGEMHVSVPVTLARGLVGCLSIRCTSSVMRPRGAVRRYGDSLRELARQIAAASA